MCDPANHLGQAGVMVDRVLGPPALRPPPIERRGCPAFLSLQPTVRRPAGLPRLAFISEKNA